MRRNHDRWWRAEAFLFLSVLASSHALAFEVPDGKPRWAAGSSPKLIPWPLARRAAQRLGFREREEWDEWVINNKPGVTSKFNWLMPDEPDKAYEEWDSWDDWLGVPLGYDEAREKVADLGVKSQEAWWAFSREHSDELLSLRVPSRPHLYYRQEWQGYDHWLSMPERPLTLPKDWPSS